MIHRAALPSVIALLLAGLAALGPSAVGAAEDSNCPLHTLHAGAHVRSSCHLTKLGSLAVSTAGGLGQIELFGDLATIVQRDEGSIAFVDISDPSAPKLLGRYDGNTGRAELDDPFDGDVAFSHDGRWLFHAHQTHQFSNDGVHVVDVSNPSSPRRVQYMPAGGTLRIAYYKDASGEYVIALDAILGLVIYEFVRAGTEGTLVPVHVDALPQLKVGGPASAGIAIDAADPILSKPLMYITTGRTGLDVYDLSTPAAPAKLGSWTERGLADIEVQATAARRVVFAATEYWFAPATSLPRVVALDASNLSSIQLLETANPRNYPAHENWRVQGIDLAGEWLYVAHSHGGLGVLRACCLTEAPYGATTDLGIDLPGARIAPYAMDVEVSEGIVYVTDASTGTLSTFTFTPCCEAP